MFALEVGITIPKSPEKIVLLIRYVLQTRLYLSIILLRDHANICYVSRLERCQRLVEIVVGGYRKRIRKVKKERFPVNEFVVDGYLRYNLIKLIFCCFLEKFKFFHYLLCL